MSRTDPPPRVRRARVWSATALSVSPLILLLGLVAKWANFEFSPYWSLPLLSVFVLTTIGVQIRYEFREKAKEAEGYRPCSKCSYDLRGQPDYDVNGARKCPECGTISERPDWEPRIRELWRNSTLRRILKK